MSRRYQAAAAAAIVFAAAVAAFLLNDAAPSRDWQLRKVYVPKGSTTAQIVRLMEEGGALRHPLAFRLLVAATVTGRKLQYGEYTFPTPPDALDVWRKVVSGDVTKFAVTVPEGSNLFDIAELLEEDDLVEADAFLAAASSQGLLRSLEIPGKSAEGFLFPDTYQFVKYMTPEEILEIMARRFRQAVTPEMEKAAGESGLSLSELVTIASIIEKETGVDEEKPLVSSVIRNRMALGMPLQMDPTVIYGLRKFDDELTRKDLRTPHPYNTYLNKGLPPGPIANPGLSALEAALAPAKTKYLYFVSRNDGSHEFSETMESHARAVASYRQRKREEERESATN